MNFELESSHERRHMPVKFQYTMTKEDEYPLNIGENYFQERYLLTLKVRTDFWSNKSQLGQKKTQAENLVYAHLFKDMIPLVKEILLEADNETIFKLATSLLNKMENDK